MEKPSPGSPLERQVEKPEGKFLRTMGRVILGGALLFGAGNIARQAFEQVGPPEIKVEVKLPSKRKLEGSVIDTKSMSYKTNLKEAGPEDSVFMEMSFRVGQNIYRTKVDTGIARKDFKMGAGLGANPDDFGQAKSILSVSRDKNGKTSTVRFDVTDGGIKMTSQEISPSGEILKEEVSLLKTSKPNIVEEETGGLYPRG